MTDRELLERAAKAAGLQLWAGSGGPYAEHPCPQLLLADGLTVFRPLTDDGDALRLAVALGMTVGVKPELNKTYAHNGDVAMRVLHSDSDPYSATRLAIVSAAAEMAP